MKKLLLPTLIALSSFCSFAQDVEIRLKLRNVLPVLAFNNAETEINYSEYSWSVFFDTDNNSLTGNAQGFDYSVSIDHYKSAASSPFSGGILNSSNKKLWSISGSSSTSIRTITVKIDTINSELVFIASKSWVQLANITANTKISALAVRYITSSYSMDETSTGTIGAGISDASNDQYGTASYADILGVRIIMNLTGIEPELTGNQLIKMYPNPSRDGVFTINDNQEVTRVSDLAGNSINFTISGNRLDLNSQPDGCYIVESTYNGKIYFEKLFKK